MVSMYDVLKASNGIHVEDSFAEIWGRKLRGEYKVKTLTGVPPFTFFADGEPLIDWSMSGQTVQASTPSQANPVAADGVGVRTGNLFNAATVTNERITWSTGATFSADDYRLSDYIPVETTQEYTCSTSVWFVGYDANKTYLGTYNDGAWDKNGLKSVTQFVNSATLGAAYVRLLKRTTSVSTIMLNAGSTAQPFEPYGYKIPITCGGQTTNIYLGSASTTRRIKKLVLTGAENWASYTSIADCYRLSIANARGVTGQGICSHYALVETTSDLVDGTFVSGQNYSYFKDVASQNLEGWKAFLAQQYANGTPVTVWYVLATPETAAVNEPLMKIGTYADELTKTGAGVNIPTVSGSNTLTVNTTVQPSEMSITFRGN